MFVCGCEVCPHAGKTIRDLLTESYITLVLDVANKISLVETRDDAISEGLLALIKAVDLITDDTINVGAWIRTWVTQNMRRYLITDSTVYVPQGDVEAYKHLRNSPSIQGEHPTRDESMPVDLLDLLDTIPKSEGEEIVLKCMIEGGYSVEDMSLMCNFSRPRVSQVRHGLIERIYNKLQELENDV
jgi:RNA polymerase sigma factor (sigma-70 family)